MGAGADSVKDMSYIAKSQWPWLEALIHRTRIYVAMYRYSDIRIWRRSGLYWDTVVCTGSVVARIAESRQPRLSSRVARAKARGMDLSRKRFARSNHFFLLLLPAMKRAVVTRVTDLLRARKSGSARSSYWRGLRVRVCVCVYNNSERILQFILLWDLW